MQLTEKQLLHIVTFALAGLLFIEAVREIRAARYRAWQRETHKHKCAICGSVWEHRNDTGQVANRRAHICPRCGAEQREKSSKNQAEWNAKIVREAGARFLDVPGETIRVQS
jgi:peptide subunit release factor 1 (eRF1)